MSFEKQKEVEELHRFADTDSSSRAIHHTLGNLPYQASPGDHTHDGERGAALWSSSDATLNQNLTDLDGIALAVYRIAEAMGLKGINNQLIGSSGPNAQVPSEATRITSGNLNNYRNPRFHFISTNADAEAISNTPINSAGSLIVIKWGSAATSVIQWYSTYQFQGAGNRVFIRSSYDSATPVWSPWLEIVTTDTAINSLSGFAAVNKGGTGRSTLTSGSYLRGNGTGSVGLRTPDQVLTDIRAARTLSGSVDITPSAPNTPTTVRVNFPSGYFTATPQVVVSPNTAVPGTTVTGTAVGSISTSGFNAYLTRTNTTTTALSWIAVQ